jgi:hypothetical protein
MRWIAVSLMIAAAAGAASPTHKASHGADAQAKLATRLAGLTPGHPIDCLPGAETRFAQTHVYGSTVLYEVNRNNVYRTETGGGCEGAGHGDVLVVKSNFGQVCSGDIAQTYEPVSRVPTGSCALGQFTPYRK